MKQPSESNYVPALGFHWLTPYYDAVAGATTREGVFKRALIEQARFEPGQRVLDLATGTGTLAIWIKQSHPQCEVTGVDGDPAILALASSKAKKARRIAAMGRYDQGIRYVSTFLVVSSKYCLIVVEP